MTFVEYTVISIVVVIILVYVYYSFRKLKLQNSLIQNQSKRISQINEILKIQNQKLIQLNLEKNQIIGVVSHDLKAPFNRLHALIGLIKMEDSPLDKNQMEHMDKIQLVISEGLSLIRNLLDIRVIEDQGIDVKPQILSVSKEVSNLLRSYEPSALKKEIKLILNNDLSQSSIETDKQYLNRMVDNLLSNAIKYTQIGGKVTIHLRNDDSYYYVSIKDEGLGIPKEEQPYLFQKFKTLSSKSTGGEGSTGLGLSIVKSLVETLGGSVECISQKNEGATFTLKIPLIITRKKRKNEVISTLG